MSETRSLGRYQLDALLGVGAFAEVYRATDRILKRKVALKVLKIDFVADNESYSRFMQEAQVAAGLIHPRIAWVWDTGEEGGRYFIAMRLVEGPALDQRIREQGRLSLDEALRIATQVGEALQFAHGQDLVHRDVKPQNILISALDGAVLTDFGLVRAVEASGSLTRTGAMVGTPQYMPPEVWEGKPASPAADQYALACVLVEMLAGQSPFSAPTPVAVMKRVFDPLVLPEGLPGWLAAVLLRALSKDPAARFASLADFMAALAPAGVGQAEKSAPKEKAPDYLSQNDLRFISLAEGVEMAFCRVPAGPFWMGSDPQQDRNARKDELPMHEVSLKEYWIGRYPVTNREYAVYVAEAGAAVPRHWEGGRPPSGQTDHPVFNVSWEDAAAFCAWLSGKCGDEIRLPSEAEWEKAARGPDGRRYPWGNVAPTPERANYGKPSGRPIPTSAVGAYSPAGDSPYSCADLAGNVWEWTADWYKVYPGGDSKTSSEFGEKYRVVRGGSWNNNENDLRSSVRLKYRPTVKFVNIGFRCAR